jgi:ATP-dependent exoDNAse (exonuclease V) beta subunit
MPFHLADAEWELEQEANLIYVAKTRAEHALVFVNGAQSAIDKGLHRRLSSQPQQETVQ